MRSRFERRERRCMVVARLGMPLSLQMIDTRPHRRGHARIRGRVRQTSDVSTHAPAELDD